MDPTGRRRIVAGAVVAIGLLVVGGVVAVAVADRGGSDDLGGDPVAVVRAAPAKVKGKRLRADVRFGTGGALTIQASQTGIFDAAAGQADVVLEGLPSGPIRLLLDGSTLYARPAQPVQGKPWGKIDVGQAGSLGSGPAAVSATQIDALFDLLTTASTAADKGREVVDGKTLRHYTATVDPGAVAGAAQLFARAGGTAPAVDLYLDGDGVPRKIAVATEAGGTKVQVTARILVVGVKDPITPPPAADVTTVSQVTELLTGRRG